MSASYMKKWEEKNRMRTYKKRIQSAKSIVSKTSFPNQRVVDVKSPAQTLYSASDDLDTHPTSADNSENTRPSSSKLSDYYLFEKENLTQIPLYRLLKHFNLQQYAKALISRGYGYDLTRLGGLNKDGLDTLIADIKILPGHKVKFMQLAAQVSQLCSEIIEQESMNFSIERSPGYRKLSYGNVKPSTAQARPGGRQVYRSTPKQATKKPSSAIGGRRPLSTKVSNPPSKREDTMESLKEKEEKDKKTTIVKLETIGPDFFSDSTDATNDEFSLILNDILEKYQSAEDSSREQPQPQSRVPLQPKKTHTQPQETGDLMGRVEKLYTNENKPKPTQQAAKPQVSSKPEVQKLNLESKGKIKSNEATKPESVKRQDKAKAVPEKSAVIKSKQAIQRTEENKELEKSPEMKARVLDLLEKKLDPKNLNKDDLNLEVRKIKDLYSSFDGAKMTSTIANIDIEEMCYCFACAIQKHVEHFIENVLPLEGSLPVKSVINEQKVSKDANKENERGTKINKQEQRDVKEVKESKPKQKEVKEQKRKEDLQYNDNDEYFIYKGKKIPIGAFEEKEQIAEDPYLKSSNRTGSRYGNEDEDEVHMEDDEEDLYGNEEYEEDDDKEVKLRTIEERDTENVDYNEEQFNDFLRQSLRGNLLDAMKRGNTLSEAQIEAERSRLNQMCSNKSNIQGLLQDKKRNFEEDEEELEEKLEEEEEEQSEFSFTMEESQYRELELSAEELDEVKRVKRLFEKTYNEKNLSAEEYSKRIKDTVGKEAISNFCKNLMITTKMEKEVIIVSLVYVERLIIKTNMYLNNVNWRRICFIAFILASKIWDDESFENENFAKVFPQYTTKEINELEKVFLELTDYDLRVSGSEYAKYYFILRTFAEKNKKSFALKPMNVQIVRMIQNKVEGTTQSLKDKYLQNTNRSFA